MAVYPPPNAIAVDVDGTLCHHGVLNGAVVEFVKRQRARGLSVMLWSARGEPYARSMAERFGVAALFNHIVSKPGYVVDDLGWSWIRHTKVITNFSGSADVPTAESVAATCSAWFEVPGRGAP